MRSGNSMCRVTGSPNISEWSTNVGKGIILKEMWTYVLNVLNRAGWMIGWNIRTIIFMRLKGSRLRLRRPRKYWMVQRRNWTNQDPEFGDAYKQSNSDFSEDFWLKLWLEHNSKLQEAQIKRKLAEQKPGLLKDPYKVGKLDSSIEIPQRAQREAASAMRRSEKAKKSEDQFLREQCGKKFGIY